MTARLLNERAQYHFDKGDFLQADNFAGLAKAVSRSAEMPWTTVNGDIRGAKVNLRMGLLIAAQTDLLRRANNFASSPTPRLPPR